LEVSLIKTECQLGVPLADAKHDVAESLRRGGQGHQLGSHLLGPLVHDRPLLLVLEHLRALP